MDIGYTINAHGFVHPVVSIPGKDSLPIVTFLVDIRLCEDTVLASIDDVLAGRAEVFEWSGDSAFATVTRDDTLMEAQWVRDESGSERGESLPTRQLRELVIAWREIQRSLA